MDKSKKKDRSWAERMLRALMLRERTELGALTIGTQMPTEMINILKSPIANTSVIEDTVNLTRVLNPFRWMDEIKSGPYKGHSTAYKALLEVPSWRSNFIKVAHPEKMETYYESLSK
jgi:hypothetical protein